MAELRIQESEDSYIIDLEEIQGDMSTIGSEIYNKMTTLSHKLISKLNNYNLIDKKIVINGYVDVNLEVYRKETEEEEKRRTDGICGSTKIYADKCKIINICKGLCLSDNMGDVYEKIESLLNLVGEDPNTLDEDINDLNDLFNWLDTRYPEI